VCYVNKRTGRQRRLAGRQPFTGWKDGLERQRWLRPLLRRAIHAGAEPHVIDTWQQSRLPAYRRAATRSKARHRRTAGPLRLDVVSKEYRSRSRAPGPWSRTWTATASSTSWRDPVASTATGIPKCEGGAGRRGTFPSYLCSDFYYESFAALCEGWRCCAGAEQKRVFCRTPGLKRSKARSSLAPIRRRPAIIAFLGAFHGRSYGGLSLTASKAVQRSGFARSSRDPPRAYGYRYRCEYCPANRVYDALHLVDRRGVVRQEVRPTASRNFRRADPGEGGYVVPLRLSERVKTICDPYASCSCATRCSARGTTGRVACEYEASSPTFCSRQRPRSGMPIARSSPKIDHEVAARRARTRSGNPVCCAAALATLDIVEKDLLPTSTRWASA